MVEDIVPPADSKTDAKRLLRLARTGALATIGDGAPITTLIGVASDWDGSPLFLMSELSRHTRNLAMDSRASLLLTSVGGRGDPLNQPRITLNGVVTRNPDPSAKARYLARNPKAKLYAEFADFAIRRLRIEAIHFNGGFGRADAISLPELLSPEYVSELVASERDLLREVDAIDPAVLATLTSGAASRQRVWRAVGLDAEGFDVAAGGVAGRVDFREPATDPASWRDRLRELIT